MAANSTNSTPKLDLANCGNCGKMLKNNEFMTCSLCENVYDLSCTTVTLRTFKSMTKDKKSSWKCRQCLSKKPKKDTSKTKTTNECPMDKLESPLLKTTSTENLASALSNAEISASSLNDDSPRSLPYISHLDNSETAELKDKLEIATIELSSAHCEIERLNIENNKLKKQIEDYQKKHNIYNKLLNEDTPKRRTPQRNLRVIAVDEAGKNKISLLEDKISQLQKKIQLLKRKMCNVLNENKQIKQRSDKEANTTLSSIKRLVITLQKTMKDLIVKSSSHGNQTSPTDSNTNTEEDFTHIVRKETTNASHNQKNDSKNKSTRKKICILSANHTNKLLRIAQHHLSVDYDLCHLLYPHVGVRHLLQDLPQKLAGFTKDDYCIVFIGEEDFKESQNYATLIKDIRNSIQKVNHTNVILCVPTFNCGDRLNMFNWRVESFNRLLYLDIITHEYAYILDSNRNLSYDHTMFHRRSGQINNRGLGQIFQDITVFLYHLSDSFIDVDNTLTQIDQYSDLDSNNVKPNKYINKITNYFKVTKKSEENSFLDQAS